MSGLAAVRLRGLQSAAHLNGALGLSKGYNEEKGRWLVQLANGEEKAVKFDNVLQTLEPGTCIYPPSEGGRALHVTIGLVTVIKNMDEPTRKKFDEDLETLNQLHKVYHEINQPEGWPQFSIIIWGDKANTEAARKDLPKYLKDYGIKMSDLAAGAGAGKRTAGDSEAGEAEKPPAEQLEVDGLVVNSLGKRERPGKKRR
eukprot:TRINITY_DN66440_c0_g1_i1.p1 TRINITY_DN66440_c0_g1~~TRINITY_DN66440_c0_g1_i1.p1  ORF type:complete len:213 (+),score=45.82 TRINITY_DN66440_c0_g1_i1:40-639(+)